MHTSVRCSSFATPGGFTRRPWGKPQRHNANLAPAPCRMMSGSCLGPAALTTRLTYRHCERMPTGPAVDDSLHPLAIASGTAASGCVNDRFDHVRRTAHRWAFRPRTSRCRSSRLPPGVSSSPTGSDRLPAGTLRRRVWAHALRSPGIAASPSTRSSFQLPQDPARVPSSGPPPLGSSGMNSRFRAGYYRIRNSHS